MAGVLQVARDGTRKLLDGYGAPPATPARLTLAEGIKEAAAPEIEDAIDRLVLTFKNRISPFLTETLGLDVGKFQLPRLFIFMLLLLRLRNNPMAAYLVIPAYFAYETVGFPIMQRLWTTLGPQLAARARLYAVIYERLLRRWWILKVPWGIRRHLRTWPQRLVLLGAAVAVALVTAMIRRAYRRLTSERARLQRQAKAFFRKQVRVYYQQRTELPEWFPDGSQNRLVGYARQALMLWPQLQAASGAWGSALDYKADPMAVVGLISVRRSMERLPLDLLAGSMVREFGASTDYSRQLLQREYARRRPGEVAKRALKMPDPPPQQQHQQHHQVNQTRAPQKYLTTPCSCAV